jgi:hypothetical protein
MDRLTIDADHVVARYVAGQLSEAEEVAFDEYTTAHPEIFREIDNTLRLKEGLQGLRERGELPALIRGSRWQSASRIGMAAALVLAVFTVWMWRHDAGPRNSVLARSPAEFLDAGARPLSIVGNYVLARSRGPMPAVEILRPAERAAVEVRILPSSHTEGGRYRIILERSSIDGEVSAVHEMNGLETAPDRYVTIYLDSSKLVPGQYRLSLVHGDPASGATEDDRFVLLVR